MEVHWSHRLVVRRGEVLGVVIGKIISALLPVDAELALANAVTDPVETHINRFGAALLDGVIDETIGTSIVRLDRRGWLGVAHFDEGSPDLASVLAIEVKASEFSFEGRAHDILQDGADDVDGAIGFGRWSIGGAINVATKVEVSTNAGASFGLRKVGGITVDAEYHVAGMVTYHAIWMGGSIVQEVGACFDSGFRAMGLGGGKSAEGRKHGVVNGSGIVEEDSNDFLESSNALLVKGFRGVRRCSELDLGTILGLGPRVG